jgi:hypothetical protein
MMAADYIISSPNRKAITSFSAVLGLLGLSGVAKEDMANNSNQHRDGPVRFKQDRRGFFGTIADWFEDMFSILKNSGGNVGGGFKRKISDMKHTIREVKKDAGFKPKPRK